MNTCGDCYKWLKTNSCPLEKGFQKGGPSANRSACDEFKEEPTVIEKVLSHGPAICIQVPKGPHQFSNRNFGEQYPCELVEYKYSDNVKLLKLHVHRNDASGGPEVCDKEEFNRWFKARGW